MNAEEFDKALRRAPTSADRLAWFGALLAAEARSPVEVAGESAIEIYLSSDAYVSQGVDIVGDRRSLAGVLGRWGFQEIEGRSHRVYWFKEAVGLVDLVGAVARSGLPPRLVHTPVGLVRVSALEPLIMRRLMRSGREDSVALFRQAIKLARLGSLDWGYLQAEAKYEQLGPILRRFKRAVARSKPRPRLGPSHVSDPDRR